MFVGNKKFSCDRAISALELPLLDSSTVPVHKLTFKGQWVVCVISMRAENAAVANRVACVDSLVEIDPNRPDIKWFRRWAPDC